MNGKVWSRRFGMMLRSIGHQFGQALLVKPQSIRWLEPLTLLLLFGLLLGLVWLVLS